MGPIASKVVADLRRSSRSAVIDLAAVRRAKQDAEQGAEPIEDDLELDDGTPAGHRFWMRALADLAKFAWSLLGARHLRKLRERLDESEERFMPGGPPMSPLTDSFHTFWCLADTTIGSKKESLAAIAADVARMYRASAEMLGAWRAIADSYPGVYRVCARSGMSVTLEELVTEERFDVELADDVPREEGTIWLTRLLPPMPALGVDAWTSLTTPYVYVPRARRAWLDYFDRQLADVPQKKRADSYRRLMKRGQGPWFWLDYILDAYVGVRGGAIELAGVPDRPESLPHSEESEAAAADASPLDRIRIRLARVATRDGFADVAAADFAAARAQFEFPDTEPETWFEAELLMLGAHSMYSAADDSGETALTRLARTANEQLDDDERATLAALREGWFSVFEVVRIKIDVGMEVRDIFRRRRHWIRERSATRTIALGDLIGGRVLEDAGDLTLEGANVHVPRLYASSASGQLRQLMAASRKQRGRTWRQRHEQIVPLVSACVARVVSSRPPVNLVNHHGEPLLVSEALYAVSDSEAAARGLASIAELDHDGDGEYVWIDRDKDVLIARVVLDSESLRVETNSRERLERVRARLESRLGDAVRHRADSFSDVQSMAHQTGAPGPELAAGEIPEEVRQLVADKLAQTLREWLDTKVPALGNRTPRQAVRSERGRDDVAAMLLEQERLLRRGPGAESIDFERLWTELDLEYPDS